MRDYTTIHITRDFDDLLTEASDDGFDYLNDSYNAKSAGITDMFAVSNGEEEVGLAACIIWPSNYQITVKYMDILDEHRGTDVSEALLRAVCDYARENVWKENRRNSIIFSDFGIDHDPYLEEMIKRVGPDYDEAKRVYIDADGHDPGDQSLGL